MSVGIGYHGPTERHSTLAGASERRRPLWGFQSKRGHQAIPAGLEHRALVSPARPEEFTQTRTAGWFTASLLTPRAIVFLLVGALEFSIWIPTEPSDAHYRFGSWAISQSAHITPNSAFTKIRLAQPETCAAMSRSKLPIARPHGFGAFARRQ